METTELAAALCKIETLTSNKLSKASEAEREIAISKCCTRAAEETVPHTTVQTEEQQWDMKARPIRFACPRDLAG